MFSIKYLLTGLCQNLVLRTSNMVCLNPFYLKESNIPVPCGKCPPCKARRASQWSFRLIQQEKISLSAHFITLTYDTDHVPFTKKGFMSLDKRDVQLFFKRLRKAHGSASNIKYYAVGEYGGQTFRPHYHAIVFNADIALFQPAWQQGQIHYGSVTGASIGYTLKYMCKAQRIPVHKNDDRIPEFSLMSKGLGVNYLTPQIVNFHTESVEENSYVVNDGKKLSMPRYYKEKIYTPEQREQLAYKAYSEAQKQLEEYNEIMQKEYPGQQQKMQKEKYIDAMRSMQKDSLTRNKI